MAVRIVKTRKVAVTRPPLLRKIAARADFDDVYVRYALETPVVLTCLSDLSCVLSMELVTERIWLTSRRNELQTVSVKTLASRWRRGATGRSTNARVQIAVIRRPQYTGILSPHCRSELPSFFIK